MLTFETPEPSQPAIEMEVDIPAEEAALTENISAEPVEEVEADPIENKQEEAPAAHLKKLSQSNMTCRKISWFKKLKLKKIKRCQ